MKSENKRQDLRTKAIVLRRTNFREADRILDLLTPEGKITVLARGVRKEKSKLAGGIEMFCLSEVNLHKSKGQFYTLTGAKMLVYYKQILADLVKLEVAAKVLKKVSRVTDQVSSEEYFCLTKQVFWGLDQEIDVRLIETWFLLNFLKIGGEEVNFLRDTQARQLVREKKYVWDVAENALRENEAGNIGEREIKIGRLMLSLDLINLIRIKDIEKNLETVLNIAYILDKN